jgi:hypothetical protein
MSQFDWPITKKVKIEIMESPPKGKILWKDGVLLPLAQSLWVRRGGLWAKHMGLKRGAIGNTFGEHIGNLEKYRERIGN